MHYFCKFCILAALAAYGTEEYRYWTQAYEKVDSNSLAAGHFSTRYVWSTAVETFSAWDKSLVFIIEPSSRWLCSNRVKDLRAKHVHLPPNVHSSLPEG